MSRSPFSFGTRVGLAGALVLGLFLAVGALLPGTWEAESTLLIPAEPNALLPYLDGPEGWSLWTTWPDSGLVRDGPERGVGARISWSHPELGSGTFEITEVDAPRSVRYRVSVEEGAMITRGLVTLEATTNGTRVAWREEGDFGWNPLMGYWALVMDGVQTEELGKGLLRLKEVAEAGAELRPVVEPRR